MIPVDRLTMFSHFEGMLRMDERQTTTRSTDDWWDRRLRWCPDTGQLFRNSSTSPTL